MSYKEKAKKLIYEQRGNGKINTKDIDGFHKGLDTCIPLVAKLLEKYDKLAIMYAEDVTSYIG